MTRRQIVIRAPSSNRREHLLKPRPSLCTSSSVSSTAASLSTTSITKVNVGETIGGTAAECAAVCCCCPCGIVNLILLVVYRVPANLCRRAWRKKKRQRLIKMGLLSAKGRKLTCGCEGEVKVTVREEVAGLVKNKDDEQQQLEKEMWERFYNTGFWRSPSQRDSKD